MILLISNFFNTHGWVVLQDNLSTSLVENGLEQWGSLKRKYASEMELSLQEYEHEVSQWRKPLGQ